MKAITIIEQHIQDWCEQHRMEPRVVLVPASLYRQYEWEQATLTAAGMPPADTGKPSAGWAEVRMIEHEGVTDVEVY